MKVIGSQNGVTNHAKLLHPVFLVLAFQAKNRAQLRLKVVRNSVHFGRLVSSNGGDPSDPFGNTRFLSDDKIFNFASLGNMSAIALLECQNTRIRQPLTFRHKTPHWCLSNEHSQRLARSHRRHTSAIPPERDQGKSLQTRHASLEYCAHV